MAFLQGTFQADRKESLGFPSKRSEDVRFLAASERPKDAKGIISNRTLSFGGFEIIPPTFGVCCLPASSYVLTSLVKRIKVRFPKWHGAMHRLSRETPDLLH
jgi:hypothetical protein